jgi:hypothetical protein
LVSWCDNVPGLRDIWMYFLFLFYFLFKLIQLDDPFTYSSLNDLVNAIQSPNVSVVPFRREVNPQIVELVSKMLLKVCFILFFFLL